MPRYRKKPVVIEAFQMTKKAANKKSHWPRWYIERELNRT